ncbi:DUF4440 domain-containing protein [Legionella oakridgensis]|uniref:DUF4440 domain-containing protein n=2 Tax=Legionella oakridgensis TaxID=29423 RepID=W0BB14_9GAMM|nr:DUF4440 domain-containing protein [Legionella oakridgensis]AHE67045.1 hypothetical protein Loa_01494 [Legionella oakridgensis ATCC 33761 = DSM 21215]ETO93330.1 hypothetical protein LOR_79c23080 [Legionella oakridgensis RV-2-2007]KTD37195.1 hypothetical protein Loak_2331 [Legionella oakridgensis]STY20139.1 Uncharacterized protein conserved in bacteria [Legionella longbeachae]
MHEEIFKTIIRQENQLLARKEPVSNLIDLIDDEFMEIGKYGEMHDKAEVARWLMSDERSEYYGVQFDAKQLADEVILLTYISENKENQGANRKQVFRSSIWRLHQGKWRMVFHQGTPLSGQK